MVVNVKKKPTLPFVCRVLLVIAGVSAVVYVGFLLNADFAEWFNRTVSPVFRFLLAKLTLVLPFSLAELCLLLLPPLVILLIVIAYRHYCDSWRHVLVFLGILASGICTVFIAFVWTFAAGYYGHTLDEKLDLEREKVDTDALYDTALLLSDAVRDLNDELLFLPDGSSLMPYSYAEMNDKLMDAYARAADKYDFIDDFSSSVKPVMLSEAMSYTHVTGIYTFFTGEANVNVAFPDYTVPFTAAHELAHQRGIAREDEANFVAFLVCLESDDPYIRYSGLMNVYEYVASALASADGERYATLWRSLSDEMRGEQIAYSRFFERYRDNPAASVSQATNDTYLKSQGASEGTQSYHLVVELAVAYYRKAGLIGTS